MVRLPVNSSTIASVGYDKARSVLEIEFIKSGVYEYHDVPEPLFNEFLKAPSQGAFFSKRIRGKYQFEKSGV